MTRVIPLRPTILAFTFLGPVIGNLVWVAGMWVAAAGANMAGVRSDATFTMWALLMLLPVSGLPFAYILGILPAFTSGLIYASLVSYVPILRKVSRRARASVAAFIGASVSAVAYVWYQDSSYIEKGLAGFILAGLVAALVLGYFWPGNGLLANE